MKLGNVILMAVLVALCVAAYFLIPGTTGPKGGTLPAVWPKLGKRDATAITLRGQGSELKLKRREGSKDRWDEIVGMEFVRADANAVDELLETLSRQSVREHYERKSLTDADIAGYGLDTPTVEVEVTVPGETVVVRFGKPTREGQNVYIDGGPGTDVWIVPRDALNSSVSAIGAGLKDKRLFDSTLFDVAKFEIVKEGVTVAELERDRGQIWHVTQPFKGYANPTKFETELSRIVNVEVEKWEEFDAPNLQRYGLVQPKYEVRLTPKGEGARPEVLLVGDHNELGGWVMEPGTKSVAMVAKRFFEAVSTDPMEYRDRSFTRLGIDGEGLEVSLGGKPYKIQRAGHVWEVEVAKVRHPGDGERIGKLLDRLREWQTIEFQDARKSEEAGIREEAADHQFVEIDLNAAGRDAPGKLTLLFGDTPDKTSVYGQRRGDGGVERVEIGPYEEMKAGPEQYFRKDVATLAADSIDELTRTHGTGPDGEKARDFAIRRDVDGADLTWRWNATGHTGKPDQNVVREMVGALQKIDALEWVEYDAAKDGPTMGFKPSVETLSMTVHVARTAGIPPERRLDVGKHRSQGGYFARFVVVGRDEDSDNQQMGNWAFVLADDVVEVLKKAVSDD